LLPQTDNLGGLCVCHAPVYIPTSWSKNIPRSPCRQHRSLGSPPHEHNAQEHKLAKNPTSPLSRSTRPCTAANKPGGGAFRAPPALFDRLVTEQAELYLAPKAERLRARLPKDIGGRLASSRQSGRHEGPKLPFDVRPDGLVGNFGDTHCGEPIELLANPLRIPGKADLRYEGLVGL
jgi:hypothetical protein